MGVEGRRAKGGGSGYQAAYHTEGEDGGRRGPTCGEDDGDDALANLAVLGRSEVLGETEEREDTRRRS